MAKSKNKLCELYTSCMTEEYDKRVHIRKDTEEETVEYRDVQNIKKFILDKCRKCRLRK